MNIVDTSASRFMDIAKGVADKVSGAEVIASVDADVAIIARVKAGDMTAFDELIKKYRDRLFSVVYNMVSNHEDAMDLVQDAFIKAFGSINSFKGNSSFYTWIYRIAVNMSISFIRKNRMRRFFSFETMNEEVAPSEIIEKLVVKTGGRKALMINELREKLNESLQNLSIKHRTVVILHEIEGLSHDEIAQITKTSAATVRTRLHYAKQQLQVLLKDYLQD